MDTPLGTAGPLRILVADDDAEDRLLLREAFEESGLPASLDFAVDGQDLLERLECTGPEAPRHPDVILLDLNMPRMDGREALQRLKSTPDLQTIPVIILTTSDAEEDIIRSYDLGVNSYVRKPATFTGLVDFAGALHRYWAACVELPRSDAANLQDLRANEALTAAST